MRRGMLLAMAVLLASHGYAADEDKRRCGDRGTTENLEVIGLTADQRLICFSERNAERAREIGFVAGLMGGETLVGIDFRPANGMLYGLGSAGGVYVINARDASAVRQATLVNAVGMTPVTPMGTSFGADFNPVPDRFRIVSDAGQNLRINVDTGVTNVDGMLNPAPGTGITAVAYTNNDADPNTVTVLYDVDTLNDQLSIQAPPNAGTLNPVGKLLVDVGSNSGFDIFAVARGGVVVDAKALAALAVGAQSQLFQVNLTTGRLSKLGTFAADKQIIGLAIPLVQSGGNDGNDGGGRDRGGHR